MIPIDLNDSIVLILPDDIGKENPRTFYFYPLKYRQFRIASKLKSELDKLKADQVDEQLEVLDQIVQLITNHMRGWKNLFRNGVDLIYDPQMIDDVISVSEVFQLFGMLVAGVSNEDKKKCALPLRSDMVNSVNPVSREPVEDTPEPTESSQSVSTIQQEESLSYRAVP